MNAFPQLAKDLSPFSENVPRYSSYGRTSILLFGRLWSGVYNGMMEWKMEWNSEHTRLQLNRVTGAVQCKLNYLVYL